MTGEIVDIILNNGSQYSVGENNVIKLTAKTELVGGKPFHYEATMANDHRIEIFDFAKVIYKPKKGEKG